MSLNPGLRSRLGDLVAATADAHCCPTVSWAVTVDGEVAESGAHGVLADGRTPSVDTVYRIASMTKSFTAATVLALRDEGQLSLDDRIAGLAPELAAITGPTSDTAPITVRHLLSMAGGMANDDAWADRHLDIGTAQIDALYRAGAVFAHPTGTAFEYSNLGFAMLGRIVQRVTGQRLQDQVTTRLLGPLGLDRTTWVRPGHDDWAQPFHVVDGTARADPLAPLDDGELASMGGLWSSAADVCRWMTWLDDATPAHDGPDDGPLRRSSRRELQQVQRYSGRKQLNGRIAPTGYGFGLIVRDDDLLGQVVAHSGGLPGYGSNMRWLAGRHTGVVALANVTYAPMTELTMQMLEAVYEQAVPEHVAAPPVDQRSVANLEPLARQLAAVLTTWAADPAAAVTSAGNAPGANGPAASEVFADNVALDEPYPRRAAAAAAALAPLGKIGLGKVELGEITATSAAGARFTLAPAHCDTSVTVAFELAPTLPLRIQSYTVGTVRR